jgi:glycosyltransferase involved in cell wall biosynthesis
VKSEDAADFNKLQRKKCSLTQLTMANIFPKPPACKAGWPWQANDVEPDLQKSDKWKWPRISIVTPSFNQGQFLEETIRSVLLQGYPNLEYIIIDGGSTDNSIDVLRRYAPWLAYWVSEPDHGQGHAINKGLKRSTGDILAWINSDDYYSAGALRRAAMYFCQHPEVDLIYGRCRVVDERGKKIGERAGSIRHYDEFLDVWNFWWKRRNFLQPEAFWTRRIWDQIGPIREDLFWVMDYEYWLRVLRAGSKVGFVNAELANFRIHSKQKSTQPEQTARELLEVVRPYIYAHDRSLNWRRRLELKAKWAFQAKFLNEAYVSVQAGEKFPKRWLRLGKLALRHPELFASRAFRDRLCGAVFRS